MKKSNQLIVFIAVVAIAIMGVLFFMGDSKTKDSGDIPAVDIGTINTSAATRTDNGWTRGDINSKNELTEFADFECPACGEYAPLITQILKNIPNLKVTFKHFPLTQHKQAIPAAIATEAAGEQGKFAEMAEVLYARQNNNEWTVSDNNNYFIAYAKALGLDTDKFKTDLGNKDLRARVESNLSEATTRKLPGTPSFFLNGQSIELQGSPAEIESLIKSKLN